MGQLAEEEELGKITLVGWEIWSSRLLPRNLLEILSRTWYLRDALLMLLISLLVLVSLLLP